ncbi:hypothetical protein B484DRAFT_607 [Ochromonadaceae sp. CCMP2298]|nr:hypothetical protein B484DRAFT_607 [Ochromonadaceae sp. CCMP2298]
MDLLPFLTLLCADLLALLCGGLLTEDAHCHCMKTVALLNLQVPRLPSLDSNEIALLFAQTDRAGGGAGANLTQGLLYLLNDNGYPHIRNCETAAVIRSPLFRGHFYTNDVKVLVDVITRELANIPPQEIDSNNTKTGTSSSGVSSNSTSTTNTSTGAGGGVGYGGEGEALFPHTRLLYLQLLEGVVSRSSWCGAGECYRAAEISLLLGEVVGRQEGGAAYAADLLAKYEYYLQ